MIDNQLFVAKYKGENGDLFAPSLDIVLRYTLHMNTGFVFVVVLCVVMGITLLLFILYHLSMIKGDLTTNEKIKKSDYLSAYEKEIKKMSKIDTSGYDAN